MKSKIIIAVALFLCGCISQEEEKKNKQQKANQMIVVTVEGCEYFASSTYRVEGVILTHKGNCKNPIHYTQTTSK